MATSQVSVDADLYVFLGIQSETLWGQIGVDFAGGPRSFVAREDEVVRDLQSLPKGLSDWRHEILSIKEEDVEARATPVAMRGSALKYVPDSLGWTPLQIVSGRLKAFLESEFPDGSMFYPFSFLSTETDQVEYPDFWFWLPKNFIYFRPAKKRGKDKLLRPQVWGSLGGLDTTWEMHHNTAFQEFVAQLPFWTPAPQFKQIVFRSDVYHRLKAQNFSGFVEADADNYLRQTPEQSVGYIHYVK